MGCAECQSWLLPLTCSRYQMHCLTREEKRNMRRGDRTVLAVKEAKQNKASTSKDPAVTKGVGEHGLLH